MLVLDGPEVADLSSPLVLWVGVEEPDEPVSTGASSEQSWAGLGAQRKDEIVTVTCVARAWSGDTNVRTVRAAAYGIVAAVEDVVRADASLGGTVLVTLSGVGNLRYQPANIPTGAMVDVVFDIVGKARI